MNLTMKQVLLHVISLMSLSNAIEGGKYSGWFPNLGLYLEHISEVAAYRGYVYIPYTFRSRAATAVPTLMFDKCPNSDIFKFQTRSVSDHLHALIPPDVIHMRDSESLNINPPQLHQPMASSHQVPSGRKKRLVGALAVAIGAIGGITWNRMSISSLQKTESAVNSYMSRSSDYINRIKHATIELQHNQMEMFHAVGGIRSWAVNLTSDFDCERIESQLFHQLIMNLAVLGSHDFFTALEGALHGKITTALLPGSHIIDLVTAHKDLKNTLYAILPSLLYEFGFFKLTHVRENPIVLGGILIVPRIEEQWTGSVINVYTVPLSSKQAYWRISVPGMIIISDQKKRTWLPSPSDCVVSTRYYLCSSHQAHVSTDPCLDGLIIRNDTSSCNLEVSTQDVDLTPVQTRAAVLVPGNTGDINLMKIGEDRVTTSSVIKTNTTPVRVTSNEADYIVVGTNHYSLIEKYEEYVDSTFWEQSMESHLSKVDLNLVPLNLRWTRTTEIPKDELIPPHLYTSHSWVLALLMIGVALILWRFKSKIPVMCKKSNRSKDVQFDLRIYLCF